MAACRVAAAVPDRALATASLRRLADRPPTTYHYITTAAAAPPPSHVTVDRPGRSRRRYSVGSGLQSAGGRGHVEVAAPPLGQGWQAGTPVTNLGLHCHHRNLERQRFRN